MKNLAREVRKANSEAERLALWKARKAAFGTVGRLGYPSYCTQDGVVPRTKLPQIMRHIRAVSEKYRVAIANATRLAARGVEHGLVERLAARLPSARPELVER